MKSRNLVVITLLVFGCGLASAQLIGTFSFVASAGSIEYCDYLVITYHSGGVVAGYENTTAGCGFTYNAPIVGFDAHTPALGLPAHGTGEVVGDGIYDDSCFCYTGLQWTLWLSDKPSKQKHGFFTGPWGWVGVAGTYTGFYFGDNYGWLAAGYPAKGEVAGHATSAGKLSQKRNK